MNRRTFLKMVGSAAIMGQSKLYASQNANYDGKFLITVQAEGGLDISSWCDPKANVPGEKIHNNWASNNEIGTAGNIQYAAFANNESFFQKHYQKMMVINGIDYQTNSHNTGQTHCWSGRLSAGYPTLTSLFSNAQAPDLPISYINNGGYSETAGIARYTRLDEVSKLRNILIPNSASWNDTNLYLHANDWQRLEQYRTQRLDELVAENGQTPRQILNRQNMKSAIEQSSQLADFTDELGGDTEFAEEEVGYKNTQSSLKLQAQLATMAMKSGVSVAADLYFGYFDTHQNHDAYHDAAITFLNNGIDAIWQYAEQYGIADRLMVVIGSDFSRTPYYNDVNGKDHWPIGSVMVMGNNVDWANRVVGVTDAGQFASALNPQTMQVDNTNGEYIYPKNVMSSLRNYLGLENDATTSRFPLQDDANFDFFNAALSTPQTSDVRNSVRG